MPCSNLRFLVVEDHEVQRRVLTALLTSLGAKVVYGAENGRAALEVIRDHGRPIDIVLSDVSMPGMDGMELIRNLAAASFPNALILNSALSPSLLSSVANMALAYKVNLLGVIGKPLSLGKLAPLIKLYREGASRASGKAFSLAEIAEARSRDEFEPCFQPKVSLSTTQVAGFHATPHWRHPQKGLLAPEVFMSSVDAYGLHDDMVWLMLEKSAMQCSQWRAQGHELSVSVSLTFTSLAEPGIAQRMTLLAQKAGIEPSWMVLGVAASAVDTDRAQALENLARLRMAGFGLAVEDFGTGAMWADQLARISFTELKISPNLISGIRQDNTARAGLVVALDTAQQLKLVSVAQGVSSLDEWNLLQGWGCDFGQGDFISGSLTADAALPWMISRNSRAQARGATGRELNLVQPVTQAGDLV